MPAKGGSGRPRATPCASSGMARRPISGHPLSTQSATSGSAARSSRVPSSDRHATGWTKNRSWRRIGRSPGFEREATDAFSDIDRLQPAATLLAQRTASIAGVRQAPEKRLQLVD